MSSSQPPASSPPEGTGERFPRGGWLAVSLAVAAVLFVLLRWRLLGLAVLGLCAVILGRALGPALTRLAARVLGPAARRLDDWLGGRISRLRDVFRAACTKSIAHSLALGWRIAICVVAVALVLAVAAAVVFVGTGVLGELLQGRSAPIPVEALYIGALISAVFATAVVATIVWLAGLIVFKQTWRARIVASAGAAIVLAGLLALSTPPVPNELDNSGASARVDAADRHDVLLVLDPADPAVQALSRYVAENVWTLERDRSGILDYDIAVGVATATNGDGAGEEIWRVVEPPTDHRRHVLDAIAEIPPATGPPVAGVYRSVWSSLRAGEGEWRESSRRTVAVVVDSLPTEAALDREQLPDSDEIPRWRALLSMTRDDRETRPPPERYARLVVLTREQRPELLALWNDYLEEIGGQLIVYDDPDHGVLANLEDAATGGVTSDQLELARRYAPLLRFDSDEQFFPVDVDQLFDRAGDGDGHQVCRHLRFDDDCRSFRDYKGLLDPADEYIDFEGGARLGADLVDRDNRLRIRRRMYVQVIPDGARLHLGYWWYFRYNVSPWQRERSCLPGLTFADATCFDHEGDWEGVTVTLDRGVGDPRRQYSPEAWRPESMSFAAHAAITRWDWEDVEKGAGGRPVVYIARGSHASYPARCTSDDGCRQALAGIGLPEGRFDGSFDWIYDDDVCCLPLPVSPEGGGALWNAFRGRWGKAECTLFVKICSQSDGPRSPSQQRRFTAPEGGTFRNQEAVLARYRERYPGPPP